jgi:hypothetical protein
MKGGRANFLSKEFRAGGVSGSCGQLCAAALREITMPRFKFLHVTSLAAILLASCTQSASRIADAGATDRDSAANIVVSGQRIDMREEVADAASRAAGNVQPAEVGAPPPPPPPAPPPPMLSMQAPAPVGAMKAMNRGFSIP